MQILDCYRIVTFVPLSYVEEVVDALCKSELLTYGNYKDVLWFSSPGTGQFTPIENANPTLGEIGKRERSEEVRLEFSIIRDNDALELLINDVLIPAHPWEEPVINIYETRETRSDISDDKELKQQKSIHKGVMIFLTALVAISVIAILLCFSGVDMNFGKRDFPPEEFIHTEGAGSVKPLPDYMIDNLKPDELEQLK